MSTVLTGVIGILFRLLLGRMDRAEKQVDATLPLVKELVEQLRSVRDEQGRLVEQIRLLREETSRELGRRT